MSPMPPVGKIQSPGSGRFLLGATGYSCPPGSVFLQMNLPDSAGKICPQSLKKLTMDSVIPIISASNTNDRTSHIHYVADISFQQ